MTTIVIALAIAMAAVFGGFVWVMAEQDRSLALEAHLDHLRHLEKMGTFAPASSIMLGERQLRRRAFAPWLLVGMGVIGMLMLIPQAVVVAAATLF